MHARHNLIRPPNLQWANTKRDRKKQGNKKTTIVIINTCACIAIGRTTSILKDAVASMDRIERLKRKRPKITSRRTKEQKRTNNKNITKSWHTQETEATTMVKLPIGKRYHAAHMKYSQPTGNQIVSLLSGTGSSWSSSDAIVDADCDVCNSPRDDLKGTYSKLLLRCTALNISTTSSHEPRRQPLAVPDRADAKSSARCPSARRTSTQAP